MFTRKAEKSLRALPKSVREKAERLAVDIRSKGPVRGEWPNYGKFDNGMGHHCHLKNGKPTYVAIWEPAGQKSFVVTYVGTHEGAPY